MSSASFLNAQFSPSPTLLTPTSLRQFTLPKLSSPPHPPPPRTSSTPAAPGSTSAIPTATILLKSTRNPALSLLLSDLPTSTTTIASLKDSVQVALGGASVVNIEKIKILYNKKPVPASKKTIADAVDDGVGKEIEFGVMVMGGAPDQVKTPAEAARSTDAASVAQQPETANSTPMEGIERVTSPPVSMAAEGSGPSGVEVLKQKEFWDDLQGFLEQRLRDEGEAGRLRKVFEGAVRAVG
jgi:ubiquitin-like protein 4